MGMSANQARLLTLTARQHDLELRAQQISAQKMALMYQSQAQATAYANALASYTSNGAYQTGSYQEVPVSFNSAWVNQYSYRTFYNFSTQVEAENVKTLSDAAIEALLAAGYQPATKTPVYNNNTNNINNYNNLGSVSSSEQICQYLAQGLQARQSIGGLKAWTFTVASYTKVGEGENAKYYPILDLSKEIRDGRGDGVPYTYLRNSQQLSTYASLEDIYNAIAEEHLEGEDTDISETLFVEYFLGGTSEAPGTFYLSVGELQQYGIVFNDGELTPAGDDDNNGSNDNDVTYSYTPITSNTELVWVPADNSEANETTANFEAAKASYDAAMVALSNTEKMLDMELTQIDTEHKAVTTEYDSVKSLIKDNTEKSFNIFG